MHDISTFTPFGKRATCMAARAMFFMLMFLPNNLVLKALKINSLFNPFGVLRALGRLDTQGRCATLGCVVRRVSTCQVKFCRFLASLKIFSDLRIPCLGHWHLVLVIYLGFGI